MTTTKNSSESCSVDGSSPQLNAEGELIWHEQYKASIEIYNGLVEENGAFGDELRLF
jgi:hypothetical protein